MIPTTLARNPYMNETSFQEQQQRTRFGSVG
jgi:hypothetical protein